MIEKIYTDYYNNISNLFDFLNESYSNEFVYYIYEGINGDLNERIKMPSWAKKAYQKGIEISKKIKEYTNEFISKVQSIVENTKQWVSGIPDKIKQLLNFLGKKLKNAIKNIKNSKKKEQIVGGIEKAISKILDISKRKILNLAEALSIDVEQLQKNIQEDREEILTGLNILKITGKKQLIQLGQDIKQMVHESSQIKHDIKRAKTGDKITYRNKKGMVKSGYFVRFLEDQNIIQLEPTRQKALMATERYAIKKSQVINIGDVIGSVKDIANYLYVSLLIIFLLPLAGLIKGSKLLLNMTIKLFYKLDNVVELEKTYETRNSLKHLKLFEEFILESEEQTETDIIDGDEIEYKVDGRNINIISVGGREIDNIDMEEEYEKNIRNKHDDEFRRKLLKYYTGYEDGTKGNQGLGGKKYIPIGFIELRIANHTASHNRLEDNQISIVTHKFDETKNKFMGLNHDFSDVETVEEAIEEINILVKKEFDRLIENKLEDVSNKYDLEEIFSTIEEIIENYGGDKHWANKYSEKINARIKELIEEGEIDQEDVDELKEEYEDYIDL